MLKILDDLNDSQRAAVTCIDSPLLVVAGPGTGKTLTIVRRIAYLIGKGINPGSIIAVTFTNRAAREMRERTLSLLGHKAGSLFIGTFHLLGLNLIRENHPGAFTIYTREEQTEILKSLFKLSARKSTEIIEKISNIKNNLNDVHSAEIALPSVVSEVRNLHASPISGGLDRFSGEQRTENGEDRYDSLPVLQDIYELYQDNLRQNKAFDFDDLILVPIRLLKDPVIASKYRDRFRYIIVDEYQDINPAQYALLKTLIGYQGNICSVGDSDQAIYAFRGADIRNFLNFEKDFPGARRITLSDNYRSTGTIVSATDQLIRNNQERIEKRSMAMRQQGNGIAIISVPDERAEGEFVIREIEARMGGTSHYQLMQGNARHGYHDNSYRFSDFAVVFRTNSQAKSIEEAFIQSGIPYQLIAGNRTTGRKEIISVLRTVLEDLSDIADMDTLLQTAVAEANLGENDLALLRNLSSAYRESPVREALTSIINELVLFTSSDAYDPRADSVLLTTFHAAKGLEFKTVFLTGMEDGLMPYTRMQDVNLEEERRLLYVGMTRAKDDLFLLHSRSRFLYGQRLSPIPSRFYYEIPREFVKSSFIPDRVKREPDKQMDLF